MTSAMNAEYVCVILVGIGKSEDKKKKDIRNYYLPQDSKWDVSGQKNKESKMSINKNNNSEDSSVVTDGVRLYYNNPRNTKVYKQVKIKAQFTSVSHEKFRVVRDLDGVT